MKLVEGYIGIVPMEQIQKMIGKSKKPGTLAEPFSSSLKTFRDPEVARLAVEQVAKCFKADCFEVAHLTMEITEGREWESFSPKDNLAVLTHPRGERAFYEFYGRIVPNVQSPLQSYIYGAELERTNFATFKTYESAILCAREIDRQWRMYFSLASFNLERGFLSNHR